MAKSTKSWAKFPKQLAPQYYKELKPIVARLRRIYNEMIEPELESLLSEQIVEVPEDQRSMDASISEMIVALFKAFREKFFNQSYNKNQEPKTTAFRRTTENRVQEAAKSIARFHKIKFGANALAMAGEKLRGEPWLKSYLKDWTIQNINLIKDIPLDTIDRLEQQITRSVLRGDSRTYLKDQIQNILKISETRAKFIARDQSGKLYGALTELRANNNGWDFYEWSTSNDEKVREIPRTNKQSDHAHLDGKIFKFSEPPVTILRGSQAGARNNPGEDYNCRCVAIVVFDQNIINNLRKQPDGSYKAVKAA